MPLDREPRGLRHTLQVRLPVTLAATIGFSFAISALAAISPVRKATNMEIVEALREYRGGGGGPRPLGRATHRPRPRPLQARDANTKRRHRPSARRQGTSSASSPTQSGTGWTPSSDTSGRSSCSGDSPSSSSCTRPSSRACLADVAANNRRSGEVHEPKQQEEPEACWLPTPSWAPS